MASGTRLDLRINFHHQTDGQFEKTIQILEDKLWAYVLDVRGGWILVGRVS